MRSWSMKFVAEGSVLLVWVAAGSSRCAARRLSLPKLLLPCLGGSGLGVLLKCLGFLAKAGLLLDSTTTFTSLVPRAAKSMKNRCGCKAEFTPC